MRLKNILLVFFIIMCLKLTAEVIVLDNGTSISGKIINEDKKNYYLLDSDGIERTIPKMMVVEVRMKETSKDNQQNYLNQNENPEIDLTNYTSISLGYGNSYGGLGARLQHKFSNLAIHAGCGYFPAPIEFADPAILLSGGLKIYLPNNQLYFDAQFGSFGIYAEEQYDYYDDYETRQETLYGPSLLFGGDWMIGDNIGLNGALGVSYNLVDVEWIDCTILLALDLGFYIKF